MESIKSQLIDMGFHETKINRAIASCPDAKTFEQVMEWLIAHEDELNNETPAPASDVKNGNPTATSAQPSGTSTSQEQATTPSGGEDTKAVDANETADNMAARKKITVEEAQRIITERQAKRAEEERKKAIEDEKKRRLDGQKMAETRAELQDQERVRLAQQIRREKLEKELHKKQVLEQIARDREAMKLRNNPKPDQTPTTPTQSSTTTTTTTSRSTNPASECRIALRFPDGSNVVHKFSPKEQLSAVRLFVQMNKKTSEDVEFVAPPNKKLTNSLMDESLESLGLCPASRLEVKYTTAPEAFVAELD